MKRHKKVTFTLPSEIITEINVKYLKELAVGNHISKSSIIKECLESSFEVFEEDLKYWDKNRKFRKKISHTIPKTYTLPFDVVEKLDEYSKRFGVKKSHLVMYGVVLSEIV